VEWPLPLEEEGEKQEVDGPEKTKQPESYKVKNNKRKTRQVKTAKITAGKGCSESKWLAAKSATS
jgi:hypothetical protein